MEIFVDGISLFSLKGMRLIFLDLDDFQLGNGNVSNIGTASGGLRLGFYSSFLATVLPCTMFSRVRVLRAGKAFRTGRADVHSYAQEVSDYFNWNSSRSYHCSASGLQGLRPLVSRLK